MKTISVHGQEFRYRQKEFPEVGIEVLNVMGGVILEAKNAAAARDAMREVVAEHRAGIAERKKQVELPTATALSAVGQYVEVTTTFGDGTIGVQHGMIVGVERTGHQIKADNNVWPGIRFKIQTPDGKTQWSTEFPDREADEAVPTP